MNAALKRWPITLRGLLTFLLLALPLYLLYLNRNRRTKMTITNKIGRDVYFKLIEYGFGLTMARILTAQAAHETGNFTSAIFKENNNLFGMKRPTIRKTTAIGENKGHAVYDSIEDSIQDLSLYFASRGYLSNYSSIIAYVAELKRKNYFEDTAEAYQTGMTNFYNLYFG